MMSVIQKAVWWLISVIYLAFFYCDRLVGRDSVVGAATDYGLDGPAIGPGASEIFRTGRTGPGAHPASYTIGTGSFLGVKRPGRGADHPHPYSAEVKEIVKLYIYFPSGPSWTVLGGLYIKIVK